MRKKAIKINIPINLKKDIEMVDFVAKDLQMKIFLVGGMPRDIIFGKEITENTDIDITEKNGNGFDLAFFVAAKYKMPEPKIYENSGTSMIIMPSGRMVEFHNSNFNKSHIIDELYKLGKEPTELNKDIYSRDFTINTLLYDLDTQEMIDTTGLAVEDIKNKILRTPISPEKILSISPKNILRGVRFKIEFGLQPTKEYSLAEKKMIPNLIDFLKLNPNSKMVLKTVQKCYSANPEKTYDEFRSLGIIPYLPQTPEQEKITKERVFGTTITPTSMEEKHTVLNFEEFNSQMKTAQQSMVRHLLEERDKHKDYMQRKRREQKVKQRKRMEIMEKARSGYYLQNIPDPTLMKKKKKHMGTPDRDFIPKKRR